MSVGATNSEYEREIAEQRRFDDFVGVIPNAELNKFFHDDLSRRPER